MTDPEEDDRRAAAPGEEPAAPALESVFSSPSYCKAFEDVEFLRRDELRAVRLQLELFKAAFPGGYGTFDELFETLTLIQTEKVPPVPVVLFGRSFWEAVVDFARLEEEGMISPEDLALFSFAETAEEAWSRIAEFHAAVDHRIPEI